MTDERLEELERLAGAATPGPWERHPMGGGVATPRRMIPGLTTEDALFVAAARTAVPELCREVRRLRGLLDICRENDPHWYDTNIAAED